MFLSAIRNESRCVNALFIFCLNCQLFRAFCHFDIINYLHLMLFYVIREYNISTTKETFKVNEIVRNNCLQWFYMRCLNPLLNLPARVMQSVVTYNKESVS